MGNEGGVQASEVGADSRYKKYLIEVERQP